MKDLFRNIANRHTSEIALIFGKQSATYQELDILSNKIAQLIIESGLAPMECPFIGLYSSRTFYTIPMMLGIWKAGFAYVPMDPKLSTERIDYILDSINKYQDIDFSQFNDAIICVRTSSESHLLEIEQRKLMAGLPSSLLAMPIKFGVGVKESMKHEVEMMLFLNNCFET